MLLRGETNFFVCSLRHHSVLIFNFSNTNRGYKIKYKKESLQLSNNSNSIALLQLSFVQLRPYVTSFLGLLFLTLISKSKKTLGLVQTLCLRLRLPLRQGLRVLFRMWVIWKIGAIVLFKTNMPHTQLLFFCTDVLHR